MVKQLFPLLFVLVAFTNCKQATQQTLDGQDKAAINNSFVKDNYTKKEVMISMRDGIKLHTTIYAPKDTSKEYPILLKRTPYSCRPYGENKFSSKSGPNKYLREEGNIMV